MSLALRLLLNADDHGAHDHHNMAPAPGVFLPADFTSGSSGVEMDHSGHDEHAGHDAGAMDHSAHEGGHSLAFFWSDSQILWFNDWDIDNTGEYVATIIGLILLGLFHERLSSYRRVLFRQYTTASIQSNQSLADKMESGGARPPISLAKLSIYQRILLGLIYAINVFLSYMLMLAVMTYNGGIFIAVVVGLAAGHAIFIRP